ncbi:MAG: hypothetical protein JWP87_6285 [Labilithrix sp.]|nr:hypothetical protein [Labilithrix sp.]
MFTACTATGSSTTIAGSSGGTGIPEDNTSGEGGTTVEGPADYAAMFGPPASTETTPNSLIGLWAGTVSGIDLRLRVAADRIVIAKRCSGQTYGLTATAIVTKTSIKTVESKSTDRSTSYGCAIEVRPAQLSTCPTGVDEYGQPLPAANCFTLDGTDLKIDAAFLRDAAQPTKTSGYGATLDVLTKLSD